MLMLIFSALILGFFIGVIFGFTMSGVMVFRSIKRKGFIELDGKLFTVKEVSIDEIPEGGRVK